MLLRPIYGVIAFVLILVVLSGIHFPGKLIDIQTFRDICMEGNNVKCDSRILNDLGERGVLKNIWGNLTVPEKKNIGIALYNYLNAYVFHATSIPATCNDPACISQDSGQCLQNALIRVIRFSDPDKSFSGCYYINGEQKIVSYYYSRSYGLHAYPVAIISSQNNFYHTIGALQLGDDVTDFNNWLFFQYYTADVRPGTWNMPLPTTVWIQGIFPGECASYGGSTIARWYIDETGAVN